MTPELRSKIAGFGRELSPDLLGGTSALMIAINRGMQAETKVIRDIAYGPEERNRLDIFTQGTPAGAPVLVFAHGGGFIMGDKHTDGSPFYSNIGDFAARHGMIGVAMTYRLAPDSQFPSGVEDFTHLVDWLRGNIAKYGGDPSKIVLSGQSAGASHTANYLAHRRDHASGSDGSAAPIAGASFLSGIYDTTTCNPNQFAKAYYGEDTKGWGPASAMAGLLASPVPMQFSTAEFDPLDFHKQAAQLVSQWTDACGAFPEMHVLTGHNHLTPAQSIGSSHTEVERMLAGFVRRVTGE